MLERLRIANSFDLTAPPLTWLNSGKTLCQLKRSKYQHSPSFSYQNIHNPHKPTAAPNYKQHTVRSSTGQHSQYTHGDLTTFAGHHFNSSLTVDKASCFSQPMTNLTTLFPAINACGFSKTSTFCPRSFRVPYTALVGWSFAAGALFSARYQLILLFSFRLSWLRVLRAFSSVVRQMPGYTSQRRGTVRTLPN